MSQEYLEIVMLMDRSGSMQAIKDDHEGGAKSFVEDQKKLGGNVRFTYVRFDSVEPFEVVYDGVPIEQVNEITLTPRGGTPLLDAMGKTIGHVQSRIEKSGRKPDQVLFLAITDGEENQSREITRTNLQKMVKEREEDGWTFLYLGANVNEFDEAAGLGVAAANAANIGTSSASINTAYKMTSGKFGAARASASADGGSWNASVKGMMNYTDQDRESLATLDTKESNQTSPPGLGNKISESKTNALNGRAGWFTRNTRNVVNDANTVISTNQPVPNNQFEQIQEEVETAATNSS